MEKKEKIKIPKRTIGLIPGSQIHMPVLPNVLSCQVFMVELFSKLITDAGFCSAAHKA